MRCSMTLAAVIAMAVVGCGSGTHAASTPADEAVEDGDAAGQGGPLLVQVTYLMEATFGPCNAFLKTYEISTVGTTSSTECKDKVGFGSFEVISEAELMEAVFVEPRVASMGIELYPVDVGEVEAAPEGTDVCLMSADQVHTLCHRADGIITFSAFDGTKLSPPKEDASRSLVLVSCVEK